MKVTVKLVVFEHPNPAEWHRYCSYCPEIQCFFGRGETVEATIEKFKTDYLVQELSLRNMSTNLKYYGWDISENSLIPPTFTDEEALQLTMKSYELPHLVNVEIFSIHVEVPPARTKW